MSESFARPKAVVDSNLFVSGTIFKRGLPFALLEAWRSRTFVLLLSNAQYAELLDVFTRDRIVVRYRLPPTEIAELFALLDEAERVQPSAVVPVSVRDQNDEHILAAALGGGADYLVTGDQDLLVLSGDPRLGALQIVTVAEFLAILDALQRDHKSG